MQAEEEILEQGGLTSGAKLSIPGGKAEKGLEIIPSSRPLTASQTGVSRDLTSETQAPEDKD